MSTAKEDRQETVAQVRRQLRSLKSSIVKKPPYCQGTLALPDSDFTLFYGKEGNAHRINLSTAPATQLQHLADTCAPATFGVAGEDVYDETYRKAGKLDRNDFLIGFDVNRSSLVDVIRTELLVENPRKVRGEDLTIELYKLNVYGKDAFFKAHVDTPRSERMFGSLVIVLPTPHEGGALKLRASGRKEGEISEWTFDASALLAHKPDPSIAYVAFFSDTEHEVMPVTSGHRVTITYNLYYATDGKETSLSAETSQSVPNQILSNEQSFRDALRALLDDASFLPEGGNLMFGLTHQYPLATSYAADEAARQALRDLAPRLKASDGVMLKVLREYALDASLKVLYVARESQWSDGMSYVMADGVLSLPKTGAMVESSAPEYLLSEGGELVKDALEIMAPKKGKSRSLYENEGMPGFWVTEHPLIRSRNGFEETMQTYGNEPTIDVVYWRIWIFARMGPAGQRTTAASA